MTALLVRPSSQGEFSEARDWVWAWVLHVTYGFERSPHEQPSTQRCDPRQLPLVRKTDEETHRGAHAEPAEDDAFGRCAGVDFVGDELVNLVYGT